MNIQSYTVLHYGKDYLPYAIRSIYPLVNQINIFYTPHPSHGHATSLPPIETEEELWQAAFTYDPDKKVHFTRVEGIRYEGQQRDYAVSKCKEFGADILLVQDYDEIWQLETLQKALTLVEETTIDWGRYIWRVNFRHFWRSFNYVCKDDGWPDRIIDLRNFPHDNYGYNYISREFGDIYHFGYAIKSSVLRYKLAIHGHHNEMRKGWLESKWYPFAKEDVHPTNDKNFWNAVPFDKTTLPEFMREHPFYDLEMIG